MENTAEKEPAKVEKKKPGYDVVGVKPGPIVHQGKTIDLATMSDAQAEWLVKTGCPFVVAK